MQISPWNKGFELMRPGSIKTTGVTQLADPLGKGVLRNNIQRVLKYKYVSTDNGKKRQKIIKRWLYTRCMISN